MHRLTLALALTTTAVLATACSKKAAVKVADPTAAPAPTRAASQEPRPASPNIGVSDDLAQQCALRFDDLRQAPKFDYDQDGLLPEDRDVLDHVATCLTSGPLKGQKVKLVGRADPRGTAEYNLGLGSRRSESVVQYLRRLGVEPRQLTATTRGDIDARGQDESSWRQDRRVDLELMR